MLVKIKRDYDNLIKNEIVKVCERGVNFSIIRFISGKKQKVNNCLLDFNISQNIKDYFTIFGCRFENKKAVM